MEGKGRPIDRASKTQTGKLLNANGEEKENRFDDLTPEQLVLLQEKMELEKLLEATKQLQQQADLLLSKKEETSSSTGSSIEQIALKTPTSSENKERTKLQHCSSNGFSEITEADRSTVTSRNQKTCADKPLAEGPEGGGSSVMQPQCSPTASANCDCPDQGFDSSAENDHFSFKGTSGLLEENAELLQKKIDLEALLKRAQLLLEHTGLQDSTDNLGGEKSSAENKVELLQQIQTNSDSKLPVDEKKSNNNLQEYDGKYSEAPNDKTDELTGEVMHQNKTTISNGSHEKGRNASELNSRRELNPASYGSSKPETSKNEFSESKTRSNVTGIAEKSVKVSDEKSGLEEKFALQQLLRKADSLLDKANRPRWFTVDPSSEAKVESVDELQALQKATSNDENTKNAEAHSDDNADKTNEELKTSTPKENDESTDDDDDDDDPSFDAKLRLQQLLQRAQLVLERSKLPVSERVLKQERPTESQLATETPKHLGDNSNLSAAKTESEAFDSVKETSATVSLGNRSETVNASPTTDDLTEVDFDSMTQDAQLEFLLRKTTSLRQQANSLIDQLNIPETQPTTDATSAQANCKNPENDDLENAHHVMEISEKKGISGPHETNSEATVADKNLSKTAEIEEFRQDAEGCQMEYEEIEESQLQIIENDKTRLEIEDDYMSDGSEMSDMMAYYEDYELSQEECEIQETPTAGVKADLQQLQKVTHLLASNEHHNQTIDTRQSQPLDSPSSNREILKSNGEICTSEGENESNDDQSQQAHDGCFASSELELLNRLDQTLVDSIGDFCDEREELRLLLAKTKLLLEKAKQPLCAEETEIESATNLCTSDNGTVESINETTIENSVQKSDSFSQNSNSAYPEYSTIDSETTFVNTDITPTLDHDQSPEKSDGIDLITEKQSSSELQVTNSSLQPESEKSDGKILCSVEEPTTTTATTTMPPTSDSNIEFDKQEKLSSVANSSALFAAQLTQLKAEIKSILQETTNEKTSNLSDAENHLQPSLNEATVQPTEESSNRSCTSDSGHSITDDVKATDSQLVCEPEASLSHTESGAPETESKTNADGTDSGSGTGLRNWSSLTNLTKLLKLQKDMAQMQLHLSNLQDSLRSASTSLQELLDEAFSET